MVNRVGSLPHASQSAYPDPSGGGDVAALQGRVQQTRAQLDDWTTCVSAKTPKGQAEIQKLSGELSAARQKIARAQQSHLNNSTNTQSSVAPDSSDATGRRGVFVDVWV
jgi:hypothetical protein